MQKYGFNAATPGLGKDAADSAESFDAIGQDMYAEEAEFEKRQNWWDGEGFRNCTRVLLTWCRPRPRRPSLLCPQP